MAALKDILLYANDGAGNAERLELCIDFARSYDASLVVLYVGRFSTESLLVDAPPSGVLIEALEKERESRREEAKKLFESKTASSGVACEFRAEDGDPVQWLSLHGRYSDLVVVGQPAEPDDLLGIGGIPAALALSCGRPVLVIPRAGAQSLSARHIMIAWNGSREATRAVNDALPLLQQAATVQVVSLGNLEQTAPGAPNCGEICRHLSRHGVSAEAIELPEPEIDPAEMLLSFATQHGAKLIVMGAYGHSRLREFALGGMTRHLLNHSPIPLLLSH